MAKKEKKHKKKKTKNKKQIDIQEKEITAVDKQPSKWRNPDQNIMRLFSKARRKKITAFMKLMTRIGDGWVWSGIAVVFFFVNINAGLTFTIALLLQVTFQLILKRLFKRNRPYIKHEDITNLMLPPDRFSFPSGHTANAFAMAFVFWYLFPVAFIPFLVLAILIAVSRMYLGLHYPTDVLAGVVLGILSARLSVWLVLLIDL